MNQSSLSQGNELSHSINPYYVHGNVFQRDPRYYDQLIDTRRSRTPNKSGFPDASSISNHIRGTNSGTALSGPFPPPYIPQPTSVIVTPPPNDNSELEELRRLRQQHQALTSQLQKLSYGGEFGTGDTVVKKGYYTASSTQTATIRDQQARIKTLQNTVRVNNDKLIRFQKASNELEVRMNNIQAIDKQIYKQLKTASTRDKQLLERANGALLRGEPKENVLRILEQIVVS